MAKKSSDQKEQKPKPHRGGMPKGHKTAKTLEKEAARELLRQMVFEKLQPLVEAQVANAVGIKYLVLRDKQSGKFTRVGKEQLEELLAGDDDGKLERLEVWEKDPSVQAFTDLMNRAIDKPVEQQQVEHSGAIEIKWQE